MVITGTRAEYGLLKPVMQAIEEHPKLNLQILVTGMHLLKQFGYTIRQIKSDGWDITAKVRLQSEIDAQYSNSLAMGSAISKMSKAMLDNKSDIIVVLGDRLEIFAATAAATACQLPIAHIHGGDIAMGIQDDTFRHAITKLSHIHFTATCGAKRRVIRLGEEKSRVYQTGSPSIDNLSDNICLKIKDLNSYSAFNVNDNFLMVLQHPAGQTTKTEEKRMLQTLRACKRKSLNTLVLYPNCDRGFSGIITAAKSYCKKHKFTLIENVPREIYLGLLKKALILIGNSSSGIIETGYLNVDVIDIGPRQLGREHGKNVMHCNYGTENVSNAIDKTLLQRDLNRKPCYIYGKGKSGIKIADVLASVQIDQKLLQKVISY